MVENKQVQIAAIPYAELLSAPYTDIEYKIAAMEKAYRMRQVDDDLGVQTFTELPRHKRMSRMFDYFSLEAEKARNQRNTAAKMGGELLTRAEAELECSEGKVSSLMSLERALSVAGFIKNNELSDTYIVGLKINGKIERNAGDRLLGHLARFGAMLDANEEEPYYYDYEKILDNISPSDTFPIFTLGSTQISASGYLHEKAKGSLDGVFALHLSHDTDKYQAIIPEQRSSQQSVIA